MVIARDDMATGSGESVLGTLLGQYPEPDMWKYINTNEMLAAAQQAGVGHAHGLPYPNLPAPATTATTTATNKPPDLASRAREMFLKRMGGIRAEMKIAAGDFLSCHIHGEMVYVFYCFAGREGCAKEPIDLFPSDQFITQFRMILS
jgi:hypothetical protein